MHDLACAFREASTNAIGLLAPIHFREMALRQLDFPHHIKRGRSNIACRMGTSQ